MIIKLYRMVKLSYVNVNKNSRKGIIMDKEYIEILKTIDSKSIKAIASITADNIDTFLDKCTLDIKIVIKKLLSVKAGQPVILTDDNRKSYNLVNEKTGENILYPDYASIRSSPRVTGTMQQWINYCKAIAEEAIMAEMANKL